MKLLDMHLELGRHMNAGFWKGNLMENTKLKDQEALVDITLRCF
jgi:hypothetical protein